MRLTSMTGLRRSTALVLTAAGLASAAAMAVPASASAATAPVSAHQAHVAHLAHLSHLHKLHVAHLNTQARVAANQASAAEQTRLHKLHIAHLNTKARVAANEASRAASRAPLASTSWNGDTSAAAVKALARSMVPAGQWEAFNAIITHESDWNIHATNGSSGAYGLPQALPGSKMASAGSDWANNPVTQIKWALSYMNDRYGSPNAAWSFWQTHHWY
ncbi:transglycosylase SLT domain-containing protein [Streptomyces sp. NPDC092296]|uniref:aggregation-promoting factor C-terminal-like domain-containing protein n=1 Tax=Streptomyces sp. NPDC092296 TaxID=3366012 RepID=UPI0037F7B7C2